MHLQTSNRKARAKAEQGGAHASIEEDRPTLAASGKLDLSQDYGQGTVGNGLDGSLPESIGNLTHVTALRLGTGVDPATLSYYGLPTNNLVGTTPSTICQMAALEDIYFRYVSDMQGTVPTCVGSLSNLTSIDYTYAGTLSGTLPRGLCDLTRLEKVLFQITSGLSGASSARNICISEHVNSSIASSKQQTLPTHRR